MAKRVYWSIFEPYKKDILRLVEEGYSVKQIYEIIFSNKAGYSYPALVSYVRKRRSTNDLPEGKFDKIPKCSECDSLKAITRCVKEKKDILMCQQTYKEVNRYGITNCPTWCPKKAEILKEGMEIGNK